MFVSKTIVQLKWARLCVRLRGTAAIGVCLLCSAKSLVAQELTWGLPGDGAWNLTDPNWVLPVPPPALGAFEDDNSVVFGGTGASPLVITLDASNVVTPSITFDATNYTITGSFAITPTAGALVIDVTAGATATVTAPLESVVADTITVNADPTSTLVLSGDNSGSAGTLTIQSGQVVIAGTYGGNLTNSGADASTSVTDLVTGDTTVTDGTLSNDADGTLRGAVAVSGDGTLIANGGAFETAAAATPSVITMTGGRVEIAAATLVDIDNDGGAVDVNAGQTLTGVVSNDGAGAILSNLGTMTGLVTNSQTVTAAGDFDAGLSNLAGTVNVTGDSSADIVNDNGIVNVGSGITLTGTVNSFGTDAELTNLGRITGLVTNSGSVLAGGQFDAGIVNTGLGASVQVIANSTADIDNNDGGAVLVNAGRTLDGSVTNDGAMAVFRNAGTVTGLVTNSAQVFASGNFDSGILNTGGAVVVTGDSQANVTNTGGDLTIRAGQVLTGDVTQSDAASATTVNGTLTGNLDVSAGTALNAGALNGDVTLSDGTVTNTGVLTGNLDVSGGDATTSGTLNGDVTVSAGTFDNTNILNGTLDVSGGAATTSGTLTGDVTVSAGTFDNTNVLTGALDVSGGAATTSGMLTGDVTVTGGTVENTGGVTGAAVVTGGVLTNRGTFAGTVLLDQGIGPAAQFNNLGGTVTQLVTNVDGALTGVGATFTNGISQSGGTSVLSGVNLGAGFANAGGTLTISGAVAATTVGNVTNTGGDLTIAAGQVLTGDVTQSDAASATTINGTLTGNLDVSAGTALNAGALNGDVMLSDGTVTNTGVLTGNLDVTGGAAATSGTLTGDVMISAGTLTNTGLLTGDLDVSGGIATTSGTLNGDVMVSDGTFTNTGGITGDLDVTGGAVSNAGVVTGPVDVSAGVLANTGTINGTVALGVADLIADDGIINGVLTNNGGTVTADGSAFNGGIVLNAGTVTITGTSSGDLRNQGGTLTVNAGQTLTGDVDQNAGLFQNNGTLAGDLDASGGVVTQAVGADIAGLTTLADGATLNADGGTFSGGLRIEGGVLNITGPLVGDVENAGDDLIFGSGQVIIGDLLNSSGTLSYAGTVQGSLTVAGGVVTTVPTTTIRDETRVTGGALNADGGAFNGGIDVAGGAVALTGDVAANGVIVRAGTFDLDAAGTLASDLVQTGGTTTLQGSLDGDVQQSGGSLVNSGDIAGSVQITGGNFVHGEGGLLAGTAVVRGTGTLFADGGDFVGQITNEGGTVAITGASQGDITNIAGTVVARTGGAQDGDVTNAATLLGEGGAISGTVTNSGTMDVTGGDLSVGAFSSTGLVDVRGGNTLTAATGAIATGSTLRINDATVAADLNIAAGAILDLRDATIAGDVDTLADFASNGALAITGALAVGDAADWTIETGRAQVGDTLTLASGATLLMQDATGLAAGRAVNNGAVTTQGRVTLDGTFENNGVLTMTASDPDDVDVSFLSDVVNRGTITGSGRLSFAGGLANAGTIDLQNGSPDDAISVSGGALSGGGTLRFDVDLSTSEGASDSVTLAADAFLTGTVNLRFNVLGSGGQQDDDILLLDLAANDPGNFTIVADDIVDPSGILTYSVVRDAAGNIVIEDGLNPAIAGLAGNIVLTQSLIGSVVNRPSSPFVTTLSYDDVDPCGAGMWGRVISGGAKSQGEVSQDGLDGRSFDGTISAYYAGVQLGGDYACFNGAYKGWDLAIGAIGGVNTGKTTQPVFAIDPSNEGNLSDLQTGTTDVDFSQFYGGIYGTAVKGPIAFDLQYRLESTNFTATNIGANGLPSLGLDNTKFSSWGKTISGAASYLYVVPDTDMTLVPTAGFAFTQVSTDPITFDSRGTVRISDFDSKIGFIGGSLAISSFGDDGVSAYREFVSATIYNDFAEGPQSTFTPIDDSGDRGLTSENLGLYSEISVGLNYVKVLQEGEFGAVKQFSAGARADVRISPRLKSWGLTAQARYQF